MAVNLSPAEQDIRRIVQAITQLIQGRCNSTGSVTLGSGAATSTQVEAPNCAPGSAVFLYPQTANAAAVVTTTYVRPADVIKGFFTISHAITPNADCTFFFDCRG